MAPKFASVKNRLPLKQNTGFPLTLARNEIINAFLKRVFSGPNAFFLDFCTQSVASARKMTPDFWADFGPLTTREKAQINLGDGATKFVAARPQNRPS
jgi:hypothetical protein